MMAGLREARAIRQVERGTGEHVRHLIEQHLERIGPRRSLLLITMVIAWLSIAVAIVVWAIAKGFVETLWITLAVASGDPTDILVAAVLWICLLLSVPLVRTGIGVWRAWTDERWEAKVALDQLEDELFPDVPSTRHIDNPRERLAQRAIDALELEVFGAPRENAGGFAARLRELARHAKKAATRLGRPPS
jgi:hypothetical protein